MTLLWIICALFVSCNAQCDETLIINDWNGLLKSPDYPSYKPNIDCSWILHVSRGNIIQITFKDFLMSASIQSFNTGDCSGATDYVSIYDGHGMTSPLIKKLCRYGMTSYIRSTENILFIRMKTGSRTSRGFSLDHTGVCVRNMTATTGTIESPNFPNNYPKTTSCEWILNNGSDKNTILNFNYFDVEQKPNCTHDYVTLHRGVGENAPQIGDRYCGYRGPSRLDVDGPVTIVFRSNFDIEFSGFQVSYSTKVYYEKNKLLTDWNGLLKSPDYPQYKPNIVSSWILRVSHGNLIEITFTAFHMATFQNNVISDCSAATDYVSIYDGNSTSHPLLNKICGQQTISGIRSTQNHLFIKMVTGSQMQRGFMLNHTGICVRSMTKTKGVIETPNFPMRYPSTTKCEWIINFGYDKKTIIYFNYFDIEQEPNCTYDYVSLHRGIGDETPRIGGRYCGFNAPSGLEIVGPATIVFHSDYDTEFSGLRLSYSTRDISAQCEENKFVREWSGQIISPYYPNYKPNMVCSWVLRVSQGNIIELNFTDFNMSTSQRNYNHRDCNDTTDYVSIYDGDSTSHPLLKKLCGQNLTSGLRSTNNSLFVKMVTGYKSHRGFLLNHTGICIRNLTTSTGTIEPPNHPLGYPRRTTCQWIIDRGSDELTTIIFNSFDMGKDPNCAYNYLTLHRGIGDGNTHLIGDRYCGSVIPSKKVVSGPLTVVFHSDNDGRDFRGFGISYSPTDVSPQCKENKLITQWRGHIKSPYYPQYKTNMICSWILRVSHGNVIEINFMDFYMSIHPRYQNDFNCNDVTAYVSIYDGNSTSHPLLKKLCGQRNISGIRSTQNFLFIKMVTGSKMQRGFVLDHTGICVRNVTKMAGTITTPNYPLRYPRTTTCQWIIDQGNHHMITNLYFKIFDIEKQPNCTYDYVTLHRGIGENASLIARPYCGFTAPKRMDVVGPVTVEFRSDYDTEFRGFELIFSVRGMNECLDCHTNATCANRTGAYECFCNGGFHGDGNTCEDINECLNNTLHNCHINATCGNIMASFNCTCKDGFEGDGIVCKGITCEVLGMTCGKHGKCSPTSNITHSCICNDDYLVENGICIKDEKLALKITLPAVFLVICAMAVTVFVQCRRGKSAIASAKEKTANYANNGYDPERYNDH